MNCIKKLFPVLLLAFLLIPSVIQAQEISRMYVWQADCELKEGESLPDSAVLWQNRGNSQEIYLPSGVDASQLFVHCTGSVTYFTVDGQRVENDSVTDVLVPGNTYTVKCGKQNLKLTVLQSDGLPTLFVKTESGKLTRLSESKKNREGGEWCVYDEGARVLHADTFNYIRLRGNYSFYPDKKSFHIKLNDGVRLLGMDKSKTWLLVASYEDNSMIRSAMTLDLAAAAGMPYTSDYRFVDVYVNHLYYGTYMACEKVRLDKSSVNISDLEKETEKLNDKALDKYKMAGVSEYRKNTMKYYKIPNNPPDISGGYLLEVQSYDRYGEENCGFVTSYGTAILFKSPECASKEQVSYMKTLIESFERAISAKDGIDPVTGKHFFEIADRDSLVGKYIIEEISKNVDANRRSFYLYKDKDEISEKLFFGPVWDYDSAYALYTNSYYKDKLTSPKGLFAAKDDDRAYYWFPKLYRHEEFVQAVKEAYNKTYRPLVQVLLGDAQGTRGLRSLNAYRDFLTPAAEANFFRWKTFNKSSFPVKTGANYIENIEYLRTFLTERMLYLDSIWGME